MTKFKSIPNGKLMFLYLSKKYYKISSVPDLEMTIYNDSTLRAAKLVLFNYNLRRCLIDMFSIKYKHYTFNLGFDSNGTFSNISFFPTFFNKYNDSYSVSYKKYEIRNANFKFVLPIFRFSRLTRSFYFSKKMRELIDSYQHLKIKDVLFDILDNDLDYIIG
jgi:hypothetical protein